MKLASFIYQGVRSYGIVKAEGMIDLGRRLGDRYSDLKALLQGNGLADATRAALAKRGTKEVLYEGLSRGEKDFSAVVTKIRAAGADVVYQLIDTPKGKLVLAKDLAEAALQRFIALTTASAAPSTNGPRALTQAYLLYAQIAEKLNNLIKGD